MPVIACVGNSNCRWALDALEVIEPGVSIHASHEFLGGGSWHTWHTQISPQGAKWNTFETDVDAAGTVDAVWLLVAPRDPVAFPAEPYLTVAESLAVEAHARSITGDIPFFVSPVQPLENCSSVGPEQYGFARTIARRIVAESNCFAGPELTAIAEALAADGCHADSPLLNDHALTLQAWFGAGGIAWS